MASDPIPSSVISERGLNVDGPPAGWSGRYSSARAFLDYGLAAVLLVATLPLLALALIVVRLTSRGPVIYRQTRVGRNGRPYTIFKVRSMRHDCERWSGPQWATTNDPRVTRFGRFLRRTHVDELPQLWNVLRGEMSLVGPRPERPEIVAQLEKAIPRYRDRERVLPGVTGLAQVQLPPDTGLDSVRQKLACDLYYIDRANLWLDLRLMICTFTKMLCIQCSFSCRLLRIPTGPWAEHGAGSVPCDTSEISVPAHATAAKEARDWFSSTDSGRALAWGD